MTLIGYLHVCQHAIQINATWNVSLSSYSHNLLFIYLVEGQPCSSAAKKSDFVKMKNWYSFKVCETEYNMYY